jgi:hypothetical protein
MMFNSSIEGRTAPKGKEPNLPGDLYGRLTLVEEAEGQGRSRWVVRCDCGEARQVQMSNLRNGHTTSCGCGQREVMAATGRANTTHGLEKHHLYDTHSGMMRRCYSQKSPKFAAYGARGITVCERWHSVENFISDLSPSHRPGLSLERVDNDLGYSPENCVWATAVQQQRNKRNNRLVSYLGKLISLAEACEIAGLPYHPVHKRLRRGWSIPQALESENFSEPL